MKSIICKGLMATFLLSLGIGTAHATEPTKKNRKSRAQSEVEIKVTPWGATAEEVERAKQAVESNATVQSYLSGKKYLLLSFTNVEGENRAGLITPPTQFRAIFYNYDDDRTIVAVGSYDNPSQVVVTEESFQPETDENEFQSAVQILKNDDALSSASKAGTLKTYQPMPPFTVLEGTSERLVNVGVRSDDDSVPHAVVGVSLKRGVVVRYKDNAPPTCRATNAGCGVPDSGQGSNSRGIAGQYQLNIVKNSVTLWEMVVTRPSASSGVEGSGIELANVRYRGKSVLKRAHIPVLNVQYVGNFCGPYRDWQYSEGSFQTAAGSTDVAPGIRVLPANTVATTVVETGNDTGNFRGVAVYTLGSETILVTEMNAGWYRYIMEWRFDEDGTIRPRFDFGSIVNSCVCSGRNHHVYWRLDFDVASASNTATIVERTRRGGKFPFDQRVNRYTPVSSEQTFQRNYSTSKSLIVKNSSGNEAYLLMPGVGDGMTDSYGVSDLWVLRYKNVPGGTDRQNEISDSRTSTAINLTPYINGESVENQDLVVWYGAHMFRNDQTRINRLGPDIRPMSW